MIDAATAARTILQRREQRKSMSAFFLWAFKVVDPSAQYKHNWHIDLIAEYLEALWEGEIKRLCVNIPPRFMKSNLITVAFPAWGLGKDPTEKFMCCSYSNTLSKKHSMDTRLLLEHEEYAQLFPGTVIAKDQNEKSKFQTTKRGHRIATSVDGGFATGDGGNFLIADDPANPKKAASELERNTINEWLDQTWSSRLNDPDTGREIMVMQRLHMDDPTGHIVDESWEHLVLPLEAEKKTVITFPRSGRIIERQEGELLHPERLNAEHVAAIKERLGSYGFSSQYQQRPSPVGGGIVKIKWFRRFGEPPAPEAISKIWISIDTATKDKEVNDPTGVEVWAETKEGYHLIEWISERLLYPDLKRKIIAVANKYNNYDVPMELLIEDKGNGSALIADLRENTSYAIIPMEPTGQGDKVVRMVNESAVVESGKCLLPEEAHWLFDWELEVENFPNAPHDEAIDTMSQFLRRVRQPSEIYIG